MGGVHTSRPDSKYKGKVHKMTRKDCKKRLRGVAKSLHWNYVWFQKTLHWNYVWFQKTPHEVVYPSVSGKPAAGLPPLSITHC